MTHQADEDVVGRQHGPLLEALDAWASACRTAVALAASVRGPPTAAEEFGVQGHRFLVEKA
jgi:hypothetical protein